MKRIILIFVFLMELSCAHVFSMDETIHKLEEVVVTSTNQNKVIDTPASISIITGDELLEMGVKNVVEALGKIPGVDDTSSKDRSVTIRGNKSAMAGGPVTLIDGIPQKIGDYRYSQFNFIPISQIERIEVLRSGGIAYGPGAARGVINIITKKKKNEGTHGEVIGSYGSWETHDENASIHGMIDKLDYLLNVGNYHTDGYETEEENRLSGMAKLGYNTSDKTRIGLRLNGIDYDQETTEGFKKKEWQLENYREESHFPKSETDSDIIWHNEKDQETESIALDFAHKDVKKFIDSTLSWTTYEEEFKRLYALYDSPKSVYYENTDQDTMTFSLSGGYHLDFGNISYTPSFGINYEYIDNDVDRNYPYYETKNTDKYNFNLKEKTYGLFWDNDFIFSEKWGMRIGGRVDRSEIEFKDKVPNTVDEDRTMFSYSVSPSYHFSDAANLYVSISRNYWLPTPRYYAWAVEKGEEFNPVEDLEPEENRTYELGYKHMFNRALNINATLYYSDYKDKFGSVYEGTTSHGQGNIGDAEAKGIEVEADGKLNEFFGYRFSAAYQNIEWTSGTASAYLHPSNESIQDADISGKQIYWVPKVSGNIGFDFYPMKGLTFSVDANYIGERYIDYLNRLEYPDKTTFDARISYSINQWKLWLLGKNIFDEDLEYVSNSSGRLTGENGEPDNAYFIQNGAYLEAGLSYRF